MASKLELIVTGDGSHTLVDHGLAETYHSRQGALNESLHVYIEAGLLAAPPRSHLDVLEIGLGTGLNALLTARAVAGAPGMRVSMTSFEPNPVPIELAARLNYPRFLPDYPEAAEILAGIHRAPWNEPVELADRFTLRKLALRFERAPPAPGSCDLIYFDAFAPNKQPGVWAPAMLAKLRKTLRDDGALTTYCAQGQFKRNLIKAGFRVEVLPGPRGRREMTRAYARPVRSGRAHS